MNNKIEGAVCKHFVIRKKRYCRMTVRTGDEYCGEHQPSSLNTVKDLNDVNGPRKRIICPLDRKHTCYANKLKQHLKKCNAKPNIEVPYISKNINVGTSITEPPQPRLLVNVPVPELLEVISKINQTHKDVISIPISNEFASHYILENELNNSEYGNTTRKHILQTSAILGLMEKYKLLQPDTCYVEFGAGKGKLSYWVSKTLDYLRYDSSSVLLVERASHRHKYDNKLDKTSGKVCRIRADIADLLLSKIEIINKSKNILGISKHLCGDATDLALHCLINSKNTGNHIMGLIMAFCCHHRCQWSTYTGREFFNTVKLSKTDFDVMCGLVGWAVCGTGQSREKKKTTENLQTQSTRDIEIGLNREEKEEIGKKCKDLINWGRKVYLESHDFECKLCFYVSRDVSLENACIIGFKNNKK